MFVVPGKGAKLDAYGNMNLGQLIAVLSKLGTIREAQGRSNRTGTRYANAQYFVSRGEHLHRGVWQRMPGHKLMPIYLFVDRVTYRRIFEFDRVAREAALRFLPEEFETAIDRALAG
jgi:hypothetical protein